MAHILEQMRQKDPSRFPGFVGQGRWIVDTKGGPGQSSFEISVLRDDNQHGKRSYGWFDDNHKRLISHNGGPCTWPVSQFVWDRLVQLAHDYAAELNQSASTGQEQSNG